MFLQVSVILLTGRVCVSQHALQVVSQYALQQVSGGGVCSWGVSAPGGVCSRGCLLQGVSARGVWPSDPGPHPRGKLRGIRSRPTPKGEIEGDQVQAHTQGGN